MFNYFVCGSFHQQEEDDPWDPSSPVRSRSSSICRSLKKNPYSTRGLDKFSLLLAELEERRQKIYEQMGSQDISFVRFVHSKSDDWVPIVVKSRDHELDKVKLVGSKIKSVTQDSKEATLDNKSQIESSASKQVQLQPQPDSSDGRTVKKKSFAWNITKLDGWSRPSYHLPIILVVILLCLVMFGRSVAIICTSIWWYLMPTIKGGDSKFRRSMKKKEYVRRLSEKKIETDGISSPKRKNMGTMKESSPISHRNGKSW